METQGRARSPQPQRPDSERLRFTNTSRSRRAPPSAVCFQQDNVTPRRAPAVDRYPDDALEEARRSAHT